MSAAAVISDLPNRVYVLEPGCDRGHFVPRRQAERMLEKKQARREGRILRLRHYTEMPACLPPRTFVARRGPLAAAGLSQQYTTANERGAVNGFKRIFPEDLHFFTMALRTACA
jgi:hypothetical protein